MSQGTIGLYSVARKLRKDKKTTEEFEVMLGNLSLEEVVALKLELSGKIIKGKLYGFQKLLKKLYSNMWFLQIAQRKLQPILWA